MFGSSGHVFRPQGGVLRNFYRCQGDPSRHIDAYTIKSVVHVPTGSHHWVSAHNIDWKATKVKACVDTVVGDYQFGINMKQPVGKGQGNQLQDRTSLVQLNHYMVKSLQEFQGKIHRGGGDGMHRPRDFVL